MISFLEKSAQTKHLTVSMSKAWPCKCCGLLNSANSPKCKACCTYACICVKCNQFYSDQIFRWTKCNDTYCIKCAAELINQSLSLQNKIPRCIHSKCNQALDSENGDPFKEFLLKKYQITQHIQEFDQMEHLIYGFIRRINTNIPNELMLKVHDYCKLLYYAKINCYQCTTLGYELVDCQKCKGLGFSQDCKQCDQIGFSQRNVKCKRCDGSGDYIFKGECRNCAGRGQYRREGKNGYVAQGECKACDGTGTFRKRYDCKRCYGNAVIPKLTICSMCKGSGYYKMKCKDCGSSGKVRCKCSKCYGYKKLIVLDFNKLCNKQAFCNKCNKYFPNDMMNYWSNCNHSFCNQCCSTNIKNEIDQQRIPTCLAPKCFEKLDVEHLKLINMQKNSRYCTKLGNLIRKTY